MSKPQLKNNSNNWSYYDLITSINGAGLSIVVNVLLDINSIKGNFWIIVKIETWFIDK